MNFKDFTAEPVPNNNCLFCNFPKSPEGYRLFYIGNHIHY